MWKCDPDLCQGCPNAILIDDGTSRCTLGAKYCIRGGQATPDQIATISTEVN